jgi:hypothetical protein
VFADEIRRAIEAADRIALPQVTAALWRAFGDGKVSEAEAEALSGLIEARTTGAPRWRDNLGAAQVLRSPDPGTLTNAEISGIASDRQNTARRAVGSRPRTDASMERRRRWAASGRLPPGLAARFTLAEQAVLSLVAAETVRRKDCRLAVGHLAAIVGVAETTVRNAIREAVKLGLVTVEERRVTGFRNDTNIVRIVSTEWTAWLRLARKGGVLNVHPSSQQGGGCKSPQRTPTEVLVLSESGKTRPSRSCRGAAGDLDRCAQPRIRAGRGAG